MQRSHSTTSFVLVFTAIIAIGLSIAVALSLVLNYKESVTSASAPSEVAVAPPEAGAAPPESGAATQESVAAPPPEPVPHIPASNAVELHIPTVNVRAGFEPGPCRVVEGAINPETMDLACTYTADDRPYELPSTHADDVVVVAGHTGALEEGVFDNLYDGDTDQHTVAVGDELFLRTKASGDEWLVYRATDLHSPEKTGLSQSAAVWGEEATPGRLLTISCVQPANPFATSVRNAVVGWQFDGIARSDDIPS